MLQSDFLDRLLSDPLGQIIAALIALVGVIWATIRKELIKSYVQSTGERVRFYAKQNRQSDKIRHRVGVPVSNLLWEGLFGRLGEVEHFGEDPVERVTKALHEDGFTWLSAAEIEEGRLDPQNCWRRPFSFREIHEGFAIDRQRSRPGGRENVTEALLDGLDGGTVHAVVGHPGSGKSTICKAVATRWYGRRDLGPVFYRESGEGGEISEPAAFEKWIEVGKRIGPVLVVVEDAVRRDAAPIFETIRRYQTDRNVSFLLDAREHEWDTDFEDVFRGLAERPDTSRRRALEGLRSEIDRHEVPPIDVREVERVIKRFKTVTGRDVREDPKELLRRIRLEEEDFAAAGRRAGIGWPSPMLLLMYHFPIGTGGTDREAKPSSLQDNVEELLETIETTDAETLGIETDDLLQEVALLINILNASGIGVYEELLYTLADTDEEYEAIERCTIKLDGSVLFGRGNGTRYWSNHPLWSELYLETFLERNGENWARKRFEACVNALFRVVDEEDRRERIQRELGRATDEFRQIKADPTERADVYVEKVFELGTARPKLAPLYGASGHSGIQGPEACSGWTRAYCSIRRSEMYVTLGRYKAADGEVEAFRNTGLDAGLDDKEVEAVYLLNKGEILLLLGEYPQAVRLFNSCLDIARDLGDQSGEAESLNNLGLVAQDQGDYETALSYYEKSLDLARDLGDQGGEAESLTNLGLVAFKQGDHETALTHYEESLDIKRDLNDRGGESTTLNNLGLVAQDQGDYETALTYYEKSLDIERNLGDRRGEATSLHNLGFVAQDQGDYESAREHLEEGLGISREIGTTRLTLVILENLVLVCRFMKDEEIAIEWCGTAISIIDDSDLELTKERERFESYLDELQNPEEKDR